MEETSNQPIHWDTHRGSINLTLILSVAVVVLGVWNFVQSGEWILMIVGAGVGAFTWLTNPRQYWIYSDALIVVYGKPRTRTISFSQVSHVDLLSLPIGDRLRVTLVNGRRVMVQAKDAETFQDRLEGALRSYHGSSWRDTVSEGRPFQDSPDGDSPADEPRERERLTLETAVQDPPAAVETPDLGVATGSSDVQDPPVVAEVVSEDPVAQNASTQEAPGVEAPAQEPVAQDDPVEHATAEETTVQDPVAQEATADDDGGQETVSGEADEDDGQTRGTRRRRPGVRRRRRRSTPSDS